MVGQKLYPCPGWLSPCMVAGESCTQPELGWKEHLGGQKCKTSPPQNETLLKFEAEGALSLGTLSLQPLAGGLQCPQESEGAIAQ